MNVKIDLWWQELLERTARGLAILKEYGVAVPEHEPVLVTNPNFWYQAWEFKFDGQGLDQTYQEVTLSEVLKRLLEMNLEEGDG